MEFDENFKKQLSNIITYTINKKLNILVKKIDQQTDVMKKILDILQKEQKQSIKSMYSTELIESTEQIDSSKQSTIEEEEDDICSIDFPIEYRELKKEDFDIEESFVKNCLNQTTLQGDIKLFKKMYIDNVPKQYYPIRHIKKKFQYWFDGHMNDDHSSGTYIVNITIQNIQKLYSHLNL
jgi:hypothetical protein